MLLTTLTDTNKYTSDELAIRYDTTVEKATVDEQEVTYYTVTRTATKRYEYRGLTLSAATSGAATKLAMYTRRYSSVLNRATVSLMKCTSDIAAVHESGNAWKVQISVNETDVKITTTEPTSPAALFASENARNYDGSGASAPLVISNTLAVTQHIDDYDVARLSWFWKVDASDAWTYLKNGSAALSDFPEQAVYIKACYGSYESNIVTRS